MPLKAGTHSDLANSMAEDIERAFLQEWPAVMGDVPAPSPLSPEMRLLFVSIAQGVIRHLQDNPSSFRVEVDAGVASGQGAIIEVQTTSTLYR